MEFGIQIDQPDLGRPSASRRLAFGAPGAPTVVILNGTATGFEGGADAPELSLKWLPVGTADYFTEGRSYRLAGTTQMLINRGQSYRMHIRAPSESFVVFVPKVAADAAWQAQTGVAEPLPEIPTAAAQSPHALQSSLARLRAETRTPEPDAARLQDLCCAVLSELAALTVARRGQAMRIPVVRRSTREELLRRLLRAEAYLSDCRGSATLTGAADAAALSPFHLIRLFSAVYGETPLAYATRKRLEQSRNDLIQSRASIASIAVKAGYNSRTAFDRAFARLFNQTPGAVRAARG
jgi:AraC family transcriptional regulator